MSLDYSEYLSLVQVRPDDIDLFGHVHSAKYLDYFLAARFEQMQKNYLCGMDEFLSKGKFALVDINTARAVSIPEWVVGRYSVKEQNT